jgi:hypothetical protein
MTSALARNFEITTPSLLAPFDLSPYGLTIRSGTTVAQWGQGLTFLADIDRSTPWWIGDAYNAGEDLFGEDAAQFLSEYANGTIRNNGYVCRRFPLSFRRDNMTPRLSFAHFQRLASLKDDHKVIEWLQTADMWDWSAARLGAELDGDVGGRKVFSLSMSDMQRNAARLVDRLPPDMVRALIVELEKQLEGVG